MNNFTPRAQQVLALARKEADQFRHDYVDTEHLLLGIIILGQGTAVNVLLKMGLDLKTVRLEVEKEAGRGPETHILGNIPYTQRVKKVLVLAGKEAMQLNHSYVGTEHILLGLLREGEGVAARVLKNLDLDIERTRNEILKELDPNFTPPEVGWLPPAPIPRKRITLGFSSAARKAVILAEAEATLKDRKAVTTADLLLGILRQEAGAAAGILKNHQVDIDRLRKEIETGQFPEE